MIIYIWLHDSKSGMWKQCKWLNFCESRSTLK